MIENILERKDDDLRYIQKILVSDKSLTTSRTTEEANYFKLPKDFFNFSSAFSRASTTECEDKKFELYEIKDANKDVLLTNEFIKPSFLAREAPYTLLSDEVKTYRDQDFNHKKFFLSYYRNPVQIKLLNEDDPEGEFDSKFNPEFDDRLVDKIISLASGEFEINEGNPKFQIDYQRAIQK